jgi:hypothetical protein
MSNLFLKMRTDVLGPQFTLPEEFADANTSNIRAAVGLLSFRTVEEI